MSSYSAMRRTPKSSCSVKLGHKQGAQAQSCRKRTAAQYALHFAYQGAVALEGGIRVASEPWQLARRKQHTL